MMFDSCMCHDDRTCGRRASGRGGRRRTNGHGTRPSASAGPRASGATSRSAALTAPHSAPSLPPRKPARSLRCADLLKCMPGTSCMVQRVACMRALQSVACQKHKVRVLDCGRLGCLSTVSCMLESFACMSSAQHGLLEASGTPSLYLTSECQSWLRVAAVEACIHELSKAWHVHDRTVCSAGVHAGWV